MAGTTCSKWFRRVLLGVFVGIPCLVIGWLVLAVLVVFFVKIPPDPSTVFERYVLDPRPASVVVLNQHEWNHGGALEDVSAQLHFRIDSKDFDRIVQRWNLELEDPSLFSRQLRRDTDFKWWTPDVLGDDLEVWHAGDIDTWTVITNAEHDEVFFTFLGM